jgi:hypothetical protein
MRSHRKAVASMHRGAVFWGVTTKIEGDERAGSRTSARWSASAFGQQHCRSLLCGEIARNVTDMAATRQQSRHALQASRGVCQANDGASYSLSATLLRRREP